MSGGAVRKEKDLARLAAEIWYRHDEKACTCPCTCAHVPDGPGVSETLDALLAPPSMDARERKWATVKLLRPITPDNPEEALTSEEELEVCVLTWVMHLDGAQLTTPLTPERARLTAERFRETVRFARRAWGMDDRVAAGRSPNNEEDASAH